MTYIKKLELQGFKSFAKKTVLNFPKGTSCIIGSNGSGKSNVAEAINFVIGKASKKDLRAERLTDFIFNGGKKGAAAPMAKVKIVFDNSDGTFNIKEKELSVSRIVSKKGSLYKINGERVTREEILSVLAKARVDPDGHNIVLQGDIQKFVDLDPMHRRNVLEEISGIAIYEDKKKKSIQNLGKVEEKIKEANIVLTEKKKLMQELEEQKKKAEEFKTAEVELRKLKASLIIKEMNNLGEAKSKIEDKIKEIGKKLKEGNVKIESFEKIIIKNKARIQEISKETRAKGFEQASEIREKILDYNNQKKNLEKETSNIDDQVKRAKESRENTRKELASQKKDYSKKEKEINVLRDQINKLKASLRDKQEKINGITSGVKYKNVDKELKENVEEIYDARGKLNSLEAKLNQLTELDDLERATKAKLKEIKSIDLEVEKKIDQSTDIGGKQGEVERQIQELQLKIYNLKTKSKLSLDMLHGGVKEILRLRDDKKLKGVVGTVYELGQADKRYTTALTVAAGARILNVVVKNPDVAKEGIGYLRSRRIGKATFLPLTELKDFTTFDKSVTKKDGVIGYAIDLIKFESKYKKVFTTIFRNTLIVEDFNAAKRIGVGRYRMVTLEGDLFETSGAITGGAREVEKMIGFKESVPQHNIDKHETKLEEYQKYLSDLLNKKQDNNEELIRLRETKARLLTERDAIEERIKTLKESTFGFSKKEFNQLKVKLKTLEMRKEELEKVVDERPEENKIDDFRKEEEELRSKLEVIIKQESEMSSKIELSILRDISSLENSIRDSEHQEAKFIKMKEDLTGALKDVTKELIEQKAIEKEFLSTMSHLAKEQNDLESEMDKSDAKIDQIRKSLVDSQERHNNYDVEKAKIVSKIEGLQEQLKEFSDVKVKKVIMTVVQIKTRISSLDGTVTRLKQNVNFGAWEMYKETEKDFSEISAKVQKLIDEQMEIQKVIDEIESRKKAAFMETFTEVNKYFDIYFKKLSKEGQARLIIQDEENIFAAGIDVMARPSGKKMVSMKSMSGGEKTITALAFIFAIQEFSPAPFYILDEVDAALDKANSQKLAELVAEHTSFAQFIIVTHNEDVISAADVLYGVFLNPNGSSEMVSLVLPKSKEDMDKIKKDMIKDKKA